MTKSYAAQSETSGMAPHTIERREPRADDVAIDICIAVSAIPTFIMYKTIGVARFIRWYRGMRLLDVSREWVLM